MILSASRRTDIPCWHAEWFMERIREGRVTVRNPRNPSQARQISLTPAETDAIVFWTKDPAPLLPYLDELEERGFRYYFQFTLTPYGSDIEPGLRDKQAIAETFCALGERLGKNGLVWRYDPIFFTEKYSMAWHREQFAALCRKLSPYTGQVTVSFLDFYKSMRGKGLAAPSQAQMEEFAAFAGGTAAAWGLSPRSCCEKLAMERWGILPASCIDKERLERLLGRRLSLKPAAGQRAGCGCFQSVDVGAYNTCGNGCLYCYANYSPALLKANLEKRSSHSPSLCGGEQAGPQPAPAGEKKPGGEQLSWF